MKRDGSRFAKKMREVGIVFRLLSYLRPYWFMHLLSLLCFTLHQLLYLVFPWSEKQLIDRVFGQRDAAFLPIVVLLMIVAAIGLYVTAVLGQYFTTLVACRTRRDMQLHVYRHIRFLPLSFFETRTTGEIMATIDNDVPTATQGIRAIGGEIITSAIQFLITLGIVFWVNPWIGLFCIPVSFVLMGLPVMLRKPIQQASQQVLEERSNFSAYLQESIAGSREIKGLRQELQDLKLLRRTIDILTRAEVRQSLIGAISTVSVVASWIANALFFIIGGKLVLDGKMSLGNLWMANRCMNRLASPLQHLQMAYQGALSALEGAKRVFSFIDKNEVETTQGLEITNLEGDVRFEDVWFGYDSSNIVLREISFHVRPGQTIALVGPSGAGKTTILRLIPRFYEPTKGRIFIDGNDISHFSPRSLRALIGIVFQDPYLFSDTVGENIRRGGRKPDEVTMDEIIAAAKAANAHEFIMKLPEGYMTSIGERGIKLSGGERQRIAIARALIGNPRLLLLDEATSALDSNSEQLVQRALERLMKGRTSFVIAHRLSTILHAGLILVVNQGQIVESGRHEELLSKGGLYTRLYNTQFASEFKQRRSE